MYVFALVCNALMVLILGVVGWAILSELALSIRDFRTRNDYTYSIKEIVMETVACLTMLSCILLVVIQIIGYMISLWNFDPQVMQIFNA